MIQIPKKIVWTVCITVIGAILTSFITFQVNVVKLGHEIELVRTTTDRDIKLLKLQFEKDDSCIARMEKQLEDNTKILLELQKTIILKQDKKFVE